MSRYDTDFNKMGFGTRAVRSGEHPDERTHALNTPIFESSTFAYETAEEYDIPNEGAAEVLLPFLKGMLQKGYIVEYKE